MEITKFTIGNELGSSGLRRDRGMIMDEFLRELQGSRGVKIYREMSENDPVLGALLFAVKHFLRGASWTVEPGSDDNAGEEAAEFVEQCRDDMSHSWEDTLDSILTMLVYGWSYHEVVYKRRTGDNRDSGKHSRFSDGRIGWRKIPIRAQDTLVEWLFDDSGGIQGMVQRDPVSMGRITLPIDSCLLFRTTTSGSNPEGRSLLRTAYTSWYRKKHLEIVEAIGVERDLTGLPTLYVPPAVLDDGGGFTAVRTAYENMMSRLRVDEQSFVMLPQEYDENGNPMYKFELMSSPGAKQFDTGAIIQRYAQAMAMSVLADVILLGHEKVGSYSLSLTKQEMFVLGLESIAKSVAGVFNRVAIPRLFRANGWKVDLPQLKVGNLEKIDLAALGEYVGKLSAAGMPLFPDEQLENFFRSAANMPLRPDDWGEMGPPRPEPPGFGADALLEPDGSAGGE